VRRAFQSGRGLPQSKTCRGGRKSNFFPQVWSVGNVQSRGKPFAVGLVVAVPAAQGGVAGVGKKKWQRRRFNVAVAKDCVGFASDGVESKNYFTTIVKSAEA